MTNRKTTVDLDQAGQAGAHLRYLGELLNNAQDALLRGEHTEALKLVRLARRAHIGASMSGNDEILVVALEFRQSEAFSEAYKDVRP